MTADDWFLVLLVLVIVVGVAVLNRGFTAEDDRSEWQRTAEAAARDRVDRDVAERRARRAAPAIEQQPGDPYSDDRIDLERMFIPSQRQPRKDQP